MASVWNMREFTTASQCRRSFGPCLLAAALTACTSSGDSSRDTNQTASASTSAGPAAAATRDGMSILARHVEACGGAEAAQKIESLHIESDIRMVGQGVKARASYWWRADGRFRQRQEIEGLGVLESGFDGEVVWSQDPIFGTRELTGLEAAQATWLASPLSWANYPAYVTDAQIEGKVTVAGGDATEVALSVRDGVKATARFLDADGRLAELSMRFESPAGAQPVTFVFKDYRPVAGYEMPHAQVLRSVTGDIHESYSRVEVNAPIADERLARVVSAEGSDEVSNPARTAEGGSPTQGVPPASPSAVTSDERRPDGP